MIKIQIDVSVANQIEASPGRVELVDATGKTIGIVCRPPNDEEIDRARSRLSNGENTMTWAQMMSKVEEATEQ